MKLKPVIIGTGFAGGTGKTTGIVSTADALTQIGYTMTYVDADASNRTLSATLPEAEASGKLVKVTLDTAGDFQGAIENIAANMTEDLGVIDMPGSAAAFFLDFFTNKTAADFEKMGVRLIVAVTIANSVVSFRGIRELAKLFAVRYPMIVLKTNMFNARHTAFDLTATKTGTAVVKASKNRVIEIPQFAELQRREYNNCTAAPSDFLLGGRAATKLGLTHLSCLEWQSYVAAMVNAVTPHAEWITGKPIPAPFKDNTSQSRAEASYLNAMDEDDF